MNLLAKREHEVPAELEKVFPGVDELVRAFFGRFIEPGSGLLRSSVFDSRWETEVNADNVIVRISCPGCRNSDFELDVTGDFLNFKMHHSGECSTQNSNRHYIFRERACAEYEECIKLPVPVRGCDAHATYVDGVVSITLPRDKKSKPQAQTIKVNCCK